MKRFFFLLVLVLGVEQITAQPKLNSPNILFIISDDLNTQIGQYMDTDKHTPNLDKLAKTGVRFSRAYSQFPLCGPSRASIMSGLYPETNGVLTNNDQPGSYRKETPSLADHPSIAGLFKENGYYTARVSKIYHMGVPGGIERGDVGGDDPDSWDYTYNVVGPETLSQGKLELLSPDNLHYGGNFSAMALDDDKTYTQTDYLATSQAIAILENRAGKLPEGGTNKKRRKKEAPFFLAVGLVRPHVPLIAPKSFFEYYPESGIDLPDYQIGENVPKAALRTRNNNIWGMSEAQQKRVISAYMASIRFMDSQVGRLLNALDRLDLRKETIVIFISDHGYNLGEHDCWSKTSLWEGSIRVPMIISHPQYSENNGKVVEDVVELIDLYPTIAHLGGLKEQQPAILQGEDLSGFITQKAFELAGPTAYTITQRGKAASIRTAQYRYTRWAEKSEGHNEELYDHQHDPEEHINLVGDKTYENILNEMRKKLDAKRKSVIR